MINLFRLVSCELPGGPNPNRKALRRKRAARRRQGLRPAGEPLEQRIALSTILWDLTTAGAGGDWDQGSNWVGGQVPGPSDIAIIPKLPIPGSVYLNTNQTHVVGGLTTDGSVTLRVASGSLSIADDSDSTLSGPVSISTGASMSFGEGASLTLAAGQTITVSGSLNFASGDQVSLMPDSRRMTRIVVGGTMNATGSSFNVGGAGKSQALACSLLVNASGRLIASDCSFDLTQVVLDTNFLQDGDLIDNSFVNNTVVRTQNRWLSYLSGNRSFCDIAIEAGTLRSGVLNLDRIGTDTTNLRYTLPGGFTIASGAKVNVAPSVTLVLPSSQTLTVNGSLNLSQGDQISLSPDALGPSRIVVAGTLNATGASFSDGGSKSSIAVSSGGTLQANGCLFDLGSLTIGPGAGAAMQGDQLGTPNSLAQLVVDTSASVAIAGNDFSGVGASGVVATGDPGVPILLANNYWGTTAPGTIAAMILDHEDDATRPAVNFQPIIEGQCVTSTSSGPASYSPTNGVVMLTASILGPDGSPVNEGTERFSVWNGTQQIGQSTDWVNVSNGVASTYFTLPADTPAGSYVVLAEYSGTDRYLPAVQQAQSLTVSPMATTTTVDANSTPTYSAGGQTISLTAQVSSAVAMLSGGTITFSVLRDGQLVGTSVQANVVDDTATADYTLPAGTPGGDYTIKATYSEPSGNYQSSIGTATLTVRAAATSVTGSDVQTTFSPVADGVLDVSARVASPAGTVGEGAVTFVLLDGTTALAAPVACDVVGGVARGHVTLPAGTPAGTYVLRALYGGTPSYAASTPVDQALIVSAAGTATALGDLSGTFSAADQALVLTAAVTSGGVAVGEGSVQFTVLDGATPIGVVAAAVSGGQAGASFTLPGGTAAGTYSIRAQYSDDAIGDYAASAADATLTVNKAMPVITWSAPKDIAYGTPLSATQLNATASVPGSFGYTPAVGTILGVGNHRVLTLTFTPADPANYDIVTASAGINVVPASLTFGSLTASQSITYGQAAVSISGTLKADTAVPQGQSVTIAIGATSATAIVQADGSFAATIGTQNLNASDSPYLIRYSFAGDANFSPASDVSTTLLVNRALLTVTANDASIGSGSPIPALSYSISGPTNGGTSAILTGTLATSAAPGSAPGVYPITQGTLTAGSNYDIAFIPGRLTVSAPSVAITGATLMKRSRRAVTAVRIEFSGELNRSSAESPAHYRLTFARSSGRRIGSRTFSIPIRAARYTWDGTVASVLLVLRRPIAAFRHVQVVTTGLIGPLGRPITGNQVAIDARIPKNG
jgi:hypothetical protein